MVNLRLSETILATIVKSAIGIAKEDDPSCPIGKGADRRLKLPLIHCCIDVRGINVRAMGDDK